MSSAVTAPPALSEKPCSEGSEWPGQPFDCHLLVQNVWYDGFERHGWDGGNHIADPEVWGLVVKRGKGDLWRVTYGDKSGLAGDEYLQQRATAFKKILPESPDPGIAGSLRPINSHPQPLCRPNESGAAHACNLFGGLGCMTAVVDVGALADRLMGMYQGQADQDDLDVYANVRRDKILKYVDA
ncbi:hypothetical protein A1O3_04098 [Capronia epimyces CBS 606.96]|uniref:FAD-binding domain-containing protein n=1 Tax=Capronia epimyces CBS 606.96 TaxID=1182542 RepID=W9YBU4_9EURO|nr:uncharacterized protein A1O3_04098 [Capronia epimyces CBS 606.96]EXJ87140.1 hypothetical protein A1O3_04098 [Capronia epimyces CBS 606.96]